MYWPWTSPHILRGASSSRSIGWLRTMGLTLLQISFISDSEMDASVPGGEPRRERRRLDMDCIGSGGGVGVGVGVSVAVAVGVVVDEDGGGVPCCCCCCCCF